jgi:hypothetical protein
VGFALSLRKIFFSFRKLMRPFVGVNRDLLKSLLFEVLLKFSEILNSLRACSDLYKLSEHAGQELTRTLSVLVRN